MPDAPDQVLITANPFSGSGANPRHVARLGAALQQAGLVPRVIWDRTERRQRLVDPQLPERVRCVVAAGGDGSITDVINELDDAGHLDAVPIATLPIGTENLFAKQFGFPRDPRKIAEAIRRGGDIRCDLGQANGRLFHLMVSAGFDADVVYRLAAWRAANPGKLKRVRRISYVPKFLGSLRAYGYPALRLEADGQTVTGAHAFVFNLPQYGGNLGLARHARTDDGRLDWVVFHKPGLLPMVRYGWCVLRGCHADQPDVSTGTARSLRLTAVPPEGQAGDMQDAAPGPVPGEVNMQADGDPAGRTPLDVSVRPAALRVIDMRLGT